MHLNELIDKLFETADLKDGELKYLIDHHTSESDQYLFEKARIRQNEVYGKDVYLRGIVEFSSYCKSDCYYCGLRCSNEAAQRYHLSEEQIMECCRMGYDFGFRTFVLQSGEDLSYSDEDICRIIRTIKDEMPDCAVTLSIGEKTKEQYQKYYDAGCDRYLLRHETASVALYQKLHPSSQTFENRKQCLYDLKEIGFQVGAGMMLQTPFQTTDDLVSDFRFMQELQPEMIGIGPFIPHAQTPFKDYPRGSAEFCLFMISLCRLMFPKALIPSTTALGTVDPEGREKGILAGANVVMPNLSPQGVRGKYLLYDGKICTGDDAAICNLCMMGRMKKIGYHVRKDRGDHPDAILHKTLA